MSYWLKRKSYQSIKNQYELTSQHISICEFVLEKCWEFQKDIANSVQIETVAHDVGSNGMGRAMWERIFVCNLRELAPNSLPILFGSPYIGQIQPFHTITTTQLISGNVRVITALAQKIILQTGSPIWVMGVWQTNTVLTDFACSSSAI